MGSRSFLFLSLLATICLFVSLHTLWVIRNGHGNISRGVRVWRNTRSHYTYADTDYPEYFPLNIGEVSLTTSESLHYSLADTQESYYAWQTLMPDGYAYVHLGHDKRLFAIAMAHELHCLGSLRDAIIESDKNAEFTSLGHSQHCLNYLRQWILCNPDLTLEPFDPLEKVFEEQVTHTGTGTTFVCRDWSAVYDGMTENLKDYLRTLRDEARHGHS